MRRPSREHWGSSSSTKRTWRVSARTCFRSSRRRPLAPADAMALPNRISPPLQVLWHGPCFVIEGGTKRRGHIARVCSAHYLAMDTNSALDAILALRAIWEQKRGRVTLADLEILVRRCVRSRGAAALPPERWRGRPWRATTRHEVVFEA